MGFPNNGQVIIPKTLKIINQTVVDISCGSYFSIIKNQKNEIFSFGLNNKGQLGLKHYNDTSVPSKIDIKGNVTKITTGSDSTLQ